MRLSRGIAAAAVGLTAVALTTAGAATAVQLSQRSPDAELLDRLPALIAFVEQERGLELRREVPVDVLADEAFVEALHEGEVEPEPDAPDLGATYDALDLLAEGDDLAEEITRSLDADVAAFYDPHAERIVVRDGMAGEELDAVLVHELTHALDDQWFHTGRDSLFDLTERGLAFASLLEGSALRVELAWWASQAADTSALEDEDEDVLPLDEVPEDAASDGDGPAPDVVAADLDFPCTAGLALVEVLLEQGGQERLDEAFRVPPLTSEQVLHPELLGSGWPLVPPLPAGQGTRVDEGVLGERGLAALLQVDPLEPDGAQVGWEGDSYATWESADGERCTSADVRMDTAGQRDRLVAALRERQVDAAPSGPTALLLHACG